MRKISAFIVAFVLALTAGLVVACSEVEVPQTSTYTVTYHYNYTGAPTDGVYKTDTYESGEVAQKPNAPTREGYTWTKWTVAAAATSAEYNFATPVTEDLDIYAQWRKNVSDEHGVLVDIKVTAPTKTYTVNDAFDKSDITVTASYTDGSTRTITDFDCTTPDMSKAGKKELTVTYKGFSKKITITVNQGQGEESKLTDIEVTPTKTFKAGDTFNKSDIKVEAVFDDGSKKEVTDFEYTTPDLSTAGPVEFTVSYGGINKPVTITVNPSQVDEPTFTDIEIVSEPTKKVYKEGETLNTEGLKVKAVYSDGSKKDVELADCKFTEYDADVVGKQNVKVTYNEQYKTFEVTVVALTEIAVTTEPTQKEYNIGDTINRAGMVVTAYYADGTDKVITDYTVEFDSSVAGDSIPVTVKYRGSDPVSFNVKVKAAALAGIELKNEPTKLKYEVGDDFDDDGLELTAIYGDGSRAPITSGWTINNFDSSKAGTCTITVSYKGFTTTESFEVEVEQITYKVTFVTGLENPAAPKEQTVNKGEYADAPTGNFKRNGYEFKGWFADGATTAYKFTTTPVTDDITLTAKWEKIPYNITYHLEGTVKFEEGVPTTVEATLSGQTTTYTIEDKVTLVKPTVTTAGVTFVAWHKGSATGTVVSEIAKGTYEHIHLYAEYTAKPTVNFYFNYNYTDAGDPFEQPVVSGLTASEIAEPSRTGYDFKGWYNTKDCDENDEYDFAAAVTEETTVFAKWDPKTLTVTFKPENGAATFTVDTVYNQTITEPDPDPQKLGHKFAGWFRISGSAQWDFAKTLEEVLSAEGKDDALTLEAHWTPENYNVVFKNGDTELKTESITFGATIPEDKKPADQTKLGHKFEGWYWNDNGTQKKWTFGTGSSASKLTTEGLELIATFTARQFEVKYVCGDNQETKMVTFGIPVPASTLDTTKTGYELDGWYWKDGENIEHKWDFAGNATLQTEGLTLTAKWNAKTVTVKFFDGNTEYTSYATIANYDGKVTKPATPEKSGYTFLHWHILDTHTIWVFDGDTFTGDNGEALPVSIVKQTSTLTLQAHWEANEYTITYEMGEHANALTAEAYAKYTYGTAFTLPNAAYVNGLVKTAGYSFEGWYDNAQFTGDPITAISANTTAGGKTFYAKITQNAKVLFTFNLRYGESSAYPTLNPVIGTKVAKPEEDPKRDHYRFTGWYNTSACNEGDMYDFNEIVTQATTVYAGWTPIQYEITFDTDDGNDPTVEYRTNAQTIEAIAEPSRTGYDFIHWYVSDETKAYAFGGHPTDNVTLKAHWELHEYTVTFDHRYQGEDGKYVTSTKKVKYTNKFTAITAPSRDGWTFSGFWYKDIELTNKWDFTTDTMPADDLTLYAGWNRNYYTVTFMDRSSEIAALKKTNVEHGSTISKPTTNLPTRTSHHLKENEEWKLNNGNVWNFGDPITRNIILNANWEINTYNVTFDSNGGSAVEAKTVNHGETVEKPVDPSKDGFTFAGWTLNGTAYNFTEEVTDHIKLVATWNGDTGTFLYYTTDGTNWNYGYKAEKNGNINELVIKSVNITNGMEFRIVTKNSSGSNIELTAGMSDSLAVKGIFTVENNGGNFKLTFTNTNYDDSVWTMYVYGLSGVTVAADGSLNKDGTATGVSLVQQHVTTKFTPDNEELTSDYLANENAAAANTIYIPGSFTDGFKLNTKWSNAANNGMLVLQDGNTYTFRHVYLQKLYGFKIYLSSDKGWYGGVYTGLDTVITLSKNDAPDVYLGSQFANGWYDIVFTNGTTKTLVIKSYVAPTVASVTVTPPTKLKYWQGQPFDSTGMKVEYTDTDGNTYTATSGYTVSLGLDTITNTTGTKTVKVTYAEKEVENAFTVTVNALTVTFDPNTGSMPVADQTKNVLYNGKATKPATATKTGYHLVANAEWRVKVSETEWEVWDFNTAVTAPITLYANWEINKYTVTFKDENGVSLGESAEVDHGALIPENKIPDTQKEGWEFTGWKNGNDAFDPTTDTVTKNLQLVAYYTRIAYDVKFIYDDGVNSAETVSVNHGDTVAIRSASRTGYTFDGWFEKNEQGQFVGEKFKFDTQIKRAYTLTAKWTVVNYNITYNLAGTVEINGVSTDVTAAMPTGYRTTYTVEDAFTLEIPTVSTNGAGFQEWRKVVDGATTTTIEAIAKGTTGDITLQAMYTANATVSFTFKYDYTDCPADVVRNIASGTTTTALTTSTDTRTGYTFLGWYEKNEGEYASEPFNFGNPVEANTVVYAKWSTNTHKVTFNANNGYWLGEGDVQLTTKEQANVEYGSTVTLTDIPTRPGYTFRHWSYNSNEYLSTDTVTMPDADVVLIAVWQLNTYTVKYDVSSTVGGAAVTATKPADGTFKVNTEFTLPATLSNVTAGYKFTGWTLDGDDIDEITLATFGDEKEVTLTAKYEVINYTVEYWVDGEKSNTANNPTSYNIAVGDKVLSIPTKTGYTFDGWYTEVEGEGENIVYKNKLTDNTLTYDLFEDANEGSAVKLHGKFVINTYTVTFDAGEEGYWVVDGEHKSQLIVEYTHGETITKPEDPTSEHYDFANWIDSSDDTPYTFGGSAEGDITLNASWDPKAKVNGLYSGDRLVRAFVPKEETGELVAKVFKVETASESAPFKVKIWLDDGFVTDPDSLVIKTSNGAATGISSNATTGEVSFKQTGIYTLYYEDNVGIYVKRLGNVEDYQEPSVDEDVDGVYIDGSRVKPFAVHTDNFNQVEAVEVEITAASNTTAVEVTFKYAGETVTLTKIDLQDGITNIGTNETVKLYKGTYSFYYNYGKNGDGKAGRLWIEGTQTGGINLTTTSYVAGDFNGWAASNADYKFDSNGVMELDINTGESFKIVKGGTWLGYDQLSIDANAALYEDSGGSTHNIKIKDGGTFQLIFDGSKLTITKVVIEAPNIAVGKYIVLGKLPKELTAADKFASITATDGMNEQYKIEFEISQATVVKIWNQTSTTTGNYVVVKEVHLNGGGKIEPVDTTMQAGKYTLYYKVYDNGAWVRLDFTKEATIEKTNELKGTKFVLTGSDSKSITIYLANANGTGVTLSDYKIWVWDTPSGNLYGTTDSDSGWSKRPTVTATMTASKALGDKISFKFTNNSGESSNLEGIPTGKTYVVTIDANRKLTIQEYVAA